MTAAKPERKRDSTGSFIFWYLGVCSIALAALIIIVVVLIFHGESETSRLQQLTAAQQQSNITQCQLANVTRQQDIAIWNQFLGDLAPPGTPVPAKEQAELNQINHLIVVKDTPRNCAQAYPN